MGIGMKKTFAEREELILKLFSDAHYVPMKEKELAIMLQVAPEERANLKKALEELLAEDKIQISKRGKYSIFDPKTANAKTERIIGTFISNQRGFGFVEVDGRQEDLFIPTLHTFAMKNSFTGSCGLFRFKVLW